MKETGDSSVNDIWIISEGRLLFRARSQMRGPQLEKEDLERRSVNDLERRSVDDFERKSTK